MILRQKEHLQLTDDQAKRLEALGKAQSDALKPQRSSMLRAEADLADAEDRENIDAQRSALEKMAKIRIDEDIARRRAMKDARDVLTPEQRDLVPRPSMNGMGRGGRGGGGNGMMQGGCGGAAGRPGGGKGMRPPSGSPVRPPN